MLTLLVPLDGSPCAEHALPLALRIARRRPARIALVSVHEPPPGVHGVQGAPVHDLTLDQLHAAELRAALGRYLDDVRRRAEALGIAAEVTGGLLDGAPAETVAAHAEAIGAGAVVMTTHGRGGVSRLWLGSVADHLVRRLAVPVLALCPTRCGVSDAEVDLRDVAGGAPVRRVLLALDGAPESEAAAESLRALAGTADVEYVLLRVVPPLHPLLRSLATEAEYARDLAEQQRLADAYLADAAERLQARGFATSVRTRLDIDAARAITACAGELGVDLIALATHGRGPAGRMLLGSVADKVLRTAPVPVLLHRVPRAAGRGDAPARDGDHATTPARGAAAPER